MRLGLDVGIGFSALLPLAPVANCPGRSWVLSELVSRSALMNHRQAERCLVSMPTCPSHTQRRLIAPESQLRYAAKAAVFCAPPLPAEQEAALDAAALPWLLRRWTERPTRMFSKEDLLVMSYSRSKAAGGERGHTGTGAGGRGSRVGWGRRWRAPGPYLGHLGSKRG